MSEEKNNLPNSAESHAVEPETPPLPFDGAEEENIEVEEEQPTVNDGRYDERLERLGGEPAPAITPEEFARLQQAGQVHIDSRGRVRTTRRSDAEAGVSLRKRRAWYG